VTRSESDYSSNTANSNHASFSLINRDVCYVGLINVLDVVKCKTTYAIMRMIYDYC